MLLRFRSLIVSTLVAVSCAAALGTAGAAPAATFTDYVALGDSWTTDVAAALPPDASSVPVDCAQSPTNYPRQVARALGIKSFRDASCSSATTEHMWKSQTAALGGITPPQLSKLRRGTDLVTLGIGGNDIGLAKTVQECLSTTRVLAPGTGCQAANTRGKVDLMSERVAATGTQVHRLIQAIRSRSPRARIVVVDYLAAVPRKAAHCWPTVPIATSDIEWIGAKLRELNMMLHSVATKNGAEVVDTYTGSVGHDACAAPGVRYVEGLVPFSARNNTPLAFPFHPNQGGADHQARAVLAHLKK